MTHSPASVLAVSAVRSPDCYTARRNPAVPSSSLHLLPFLVPLGPVVRAICNFWVSCSPCACPRASGAPLNSPTHDLLPVKPQHHCHRSLESDAGCRQDSGPYGEQAQFGPRDTLDNSSGNNRQFWLLPLEKHYRLLIGRDLRYC